MHFKEHCNLCDNLETNLQDGITCGLTNQKPKFNKTCPKIRLSEKFKEELGLIHIKIERLKKKKKSIYTNFYLSMAIGCILILGGNSFMEFTFPNSIFITKVTLALIMGGFGLFLFAYGRLIKYRNKIKITRDEKRRIDAVLNKYHIEYSCSVIFEEKYHGIQNVVAELKSKSDLLKNSKITYQINAI